MKAKKILFLTQEITPYVPESPISLLGRKLPQAVQEKSREIRTFMPRWGTINERRNQLHEVIRLSGMNLIIDETDHPLIIKVASIPSARMQVYFIDNDDYFSRKQMAFDIKGREYKDNPERAVFYARGVLETVKKLRWVPDIIHCQGWITSIVPLYLKTAYAEEPCFRDVRVIYTPSGMDLKANLGKKFPNALHYRSADYNVLASLAEKPNMQTLNLLGIKYADGVAVNEPCDELMTFARKHKKTILPAQEAENYGTAYTEFFDTIWSAGKPDVQDEDEEKA